MFSQAPTILPGPRTEHGGQLGLVSLPTDLLWLLSTQCMVLGGPGNAVVTLLYHGNEHM